MFPRIFLLHRRRQQIVLRIIVDHGLGQYLVLLRVSRRMLQMGFHKGSDLIHIKINVRDIFRPDILDPVKAFQYAVQQIFRVNRHSLRLSFCLYCKTAF